MKDVKNILKEAINSIQIKYLERNERDFAYELYSKLKSIDFGENIEVTSESTKKRFSINDKIFENPLVRRYFFNNNNLIPQNIHKYPDLLIHEYDNRNNQLLAIEIKKRISIQLILKDLAKLIVYCKGNLKYKKGILVLVNPNNLRQNLIEVPEIKKLIIDYPEIEIWIVKPNGNLEIINSITI